MEAEVLSPRSMRTGRRRCDLLLTVVLICGGAGACPVHAQHVVTSMDIHALSADPWPVEVSAARSGEDIVVRGTARFMNACVAQAGFDATFRDLSPLSATGTRLLLLRGRRPGSGLS